MGVKPNNIVAAEYVEQATEPLTFWFDGRLSTKNEVLRALRAAQMFESGIVENNGNDYWFSGTLDGEAFTLTISGNAVARKIQELRLRTDGVSS